MVIAAVLSVILDHLARARHKRWLLTADLEEITGELGIDETTAPGR